MSALKSEITSNPPMMQTTLRKIRAAGPFGMQLDDGRRVGYLKLRHHLGKGHGDNTPIDIATILDSSDAGQHARKSLPNERGLR